MGLDEGGNSAWGRSQVEGSAWKGIREETVIVGRDKVQQVIS